MKIFDGIFGSDDSSDETNDSSNTSENSPSQPMFRRSADEWKYAYDELDVEIIGDNETLSIGYNEEDQKRTDTEAYAGKWARQVIASRLAKDRHRDKTWLGYSNGALQGLTPEGVRHDALFKHASIFGRTGYGKSTLLKNMMLQWIMSGYGLCFFDLHGKDSMDLLKSIPKHRLDDVVWIEPAGKYDREVGMNFFEPSSERGTSAYEKEVKNIENDFVELIDVQDGKQMAPITKTIVRQLVKAEQNFTPIEFYKILEEEEEKELLAEHFGDSFERPALRRLQEYDAEDLQPIKRRVKDWVEQKQTRQILSRRESTISISDAMESNKIIIFNINHLSDDMKAVIASTIIRRIWNGARDRDPAENNRPFYLVLDEFHKLEHPKMPIPSILAEARKFSLSLTLCTQHIEQITSQEVVDEMENNCDTFLSFNPTSGSPSKAKSVAQIVGQNVSPHALMELPPFELVGRIYNGKKDLKETVDIKTFAPFPPLRTEKEAKKEIRKSLQKYGAEVEDKGTINFDDYSLKNHIHDTDSESTQSGKAICTTDSGEKIYQKQVLEALHTAEIRYETISEYDKDGWVKDSDLMSELEKYIEEGTGYASVFSNGMEKISDKLIEQGQYSGETIYRLTSEGEEKVFVQDTGSGGSAGKKDHRRVLSEAYKIFTKLGYQVKLPSQDVDGQLPDGIAEPPIKPSEGENMEEIEQLRDKLLNEYPNVWNLFKDSTVSIESETTTPSRPSQPMTNLSKALNKGRKCAFIVPDGNILKSSPEDNDKDPEALAKRLENIFTDPPCVRSIDDGFKRYYNGSGKMELKDGTSPVYDTRTKNGNIVWKKNMNSGQIELTQTKRDRPIARFRNETELESPSGNKFDYRARENNGIIEIIRGKDSAVIEEYNTKGDMKQDWSYISPPELPKNHFEDGIPKREDWMIILLPEPQRSLNGPQVYENGNIIPLKQYISEKSNDENQQTLFDQIDAEKSDSITEKTTDSSNSEETGEEPEETEKESQEPIDSSNSEESQETEEEITTEDSIDNSNVNASEKTENDVNEASAESSTNKTEDTEVEDTTTEDNLIPYEELHNSQVELRDERTNTENNTNSSIHNKNKPSNTTPQEKDLEVFIGEVENEVDSKLTTGTEPGTEPSTESLNSTKTTSESDENIEEEFFSEIIDN